MPSGVGEAAYGQVREILEGQERFVLTTHRDADGDGLGAQCALAEALHQLGKDVRVINNEPLPAPYRFLPGSVAFETFRPRAHRGASAGPCPRRASGKVRSVRAAGYDGQS